MAQEKDNSKEEKRLQELKQLKRKNRRMSAVLLIGVLQFGSLALCYYLGRSCKRG